LFDSSFPLKQGLPGGDDDAATAKDALNIYPAARGTSRFFLHPETAATTLAVYGPWGSGKVGTG